MERLTKKQVQKKVISTLMYSIGGRTVNLYSSHPVVRKLVDLVVDLYDRETELLKTIEEIKEQGVIKHPYYPYWDSMMGHCACVLCRFYRREQADTVKDISKRANKDDKEESDGT